MEACRDIESCNADPARQELIIQFLSDTSGAIQNVNYSFLPAGSDVLFVFDSTYFVAEEDTIIYGTFVPEGDSILLPEGNRAALDLDANRDSITYYFILPDGTIPDTLNLRYNREFSIYDPECPPSLTYVNIDTVSQTFDSLKIVGTVTDVQITTHIEIYL